MLTSDLHFDYPERLVAQEPQADFRTMLVDIQAQQNNSKSLPHEVSKQGLFDIFRPGDVLVVNDTRVLARRVMAPNGLEILFLKPVAAAQANNDSVNSHPAESSGCQWEVLFPAREVRDGEEFALPSSEHKITAKLVRRGLPQILEVSQPLTEAYFAEFGELALPPYIQKARGERRNRPQDRDWYQTAWAQTPGSFAAPTASLHFSQADMNELRARGVSIVPLTLHVGLGTFLPVKTAKLDDHKMHTEQVLIPKSSIAQIQNCKTSGSGRVWALGTTVTRALESWACGRLNETNEAFVGETDLFIRPGYKFEVVDCLLTNFHQPGSTLLALVSAFAGSLDTVLSAYTWAISQNFRLFSYGDLTAWVKK